MADARQRIGRPPLAVSCGDPNGIGPELALAAWARRGSETVPPFYLLADPELLTRRGAAVGTDARIALCEPREASSAFADALPVLPLKSECHDAPGRADPHNAGAVMEAIERGVTACFDGQASGLVTLPISKAPLYEAGFAFPGHTEYLGDLCMARTGQDVQPVMLLAAPELMAVPVTIHIPLHAVPGALTAPLLERTIRITHTDLIRRFAIAAPRIAVSGLNPHAGESGRMGHEEAEIIEPVVERLRAAGMSVTGPLPGDTMFHASARSRYDVAICMYHDQALIPVKTLGFDHGVNVTLGLPIIRTSPDHGTAFDIAGRGIASPDSFIAALRLAEKMAASEPAAA